MSENIPEEHFEEGHEAPPPGVEWMATFRWMLLIFFAALALFMVVRELGLSAPRVAVKEHHQQYTCPMHPQIIRDAPGKCPICSMDLVVMQDESESQPSPPTEMSDSRPSPEGLAEVKLSPARIQKIGLTTAPAITRSFSPRVEAVGSIAVDEARLAEVHAWVDGFILYLKPLRVGDPVKKGELLATLYSPEVEEAEREYLLLLGGAALNEHGGSALLEATKSRLKTLKLSRADISAVEKAGTPLPLSIVANASGVILERAVSLGAAVKPEEALFKTVDLGVVFAVVSVYERDLPLVALGQTVTVTSAALPGKLFSGELSLIYPNIDPETRTAKVRVELKNPALELLPGMFIEASIAGKATSGVAVPRDALIETGKHRYLFLAQAEGRFTPISVAVGARDADFVEITSGLAAGDLVVLSAGFLLDAESRLRGELE